MKCQDKIRSEIIKQFILNGKCLTHFMDRGNLHISECTKQVHKSHLMNKDCTNLFHKGHIPHSSAIQGKLNKHNQISIVHYQKEKFCSSIFK